MYKSRSVNAKQAFQEALQRNAQIASKIACSFVTRDSSSFQPLPAFPEPVSTTYSICSIGGKKSESDPSVSYRIVEMMKNYDMAAEKNDKISAVIDDGGVCGAA